ncbi:MAG: ATP-binding cassette domain-containing protein [Acetobacteraceae bacterium]
MSDDGQGEAIRAENIVKRFGSITALNGISIYVNRGEMLGILGDNGAGKSTLIKCLTGFHQPDTGQIYVGGKPVTLDSVDRARAFGIECVYQDLALINTLSVFHNMFLNRELRKPPFGLLDHARMRRQAIAALDDVGVGVPSVDVEVAQLSGGQRQAIAVARAVHSNVRILLLDEPLAAMGARESGLIIDLLERLRARGDIAMAMIAHNYAQTLDVCDRVVLVQHGEITYSGRSAETSVEQLLEIVRREYRAARRARQ